VKRPTRAQIATSAAALALLAGGAGMAVAASGCGGDDETIPPSESKPASKPETTSKPPTTSEPEATTSAPANALVKRRRRNRSERGIQKSVTRLVDTAERNDARGFCGLVGRPVPSGSADAVGACARAANVAIEALPTSDELSIGRVKLAGGSATVALTGGVRVSLKRRGAVWTVTGVKAG
jgi:hypothetical protein